MEDALFASQELRVETRSDIRTMPSFHKAIRFTGELICDCKKPEETGGGYLIHCRDHGNSERIAKVGKFETWTDLPAGSEIELYFNEKQNVFMRSIKYNGAEVNPAFLIDPDAPEHSLVVTLSDKGAEINGKVATNGSSIEGAHVLLTPWPVATREGYPAYRESDVDSSGKFQFRNLAPGKYRIISIGPSAWERRGRPGVINDWIGLAEEIRLEESRTSTVNLECKIL